jgi:starch synthase
VDRQGGQGRLAMTMARWRFLLKRHREAGSMTERQVLAVASEIYPLIKTGGLADVAGALPGALAHEGVKMRTLVPGYPAVLAGLEEASELLSLPGVFGGARLLAAKASSLDLFVLDAPHLYARPGNPYVGPDGADWPDNAFRFGALAKVAAEIGLGLLPAFLPEAVHMHDWQAGLAAAYLHYSGRPALPGTVMTIHNLAYQGRFPAELLKPLGLPPAAFTMEGVEHFGAIGFLKAGLQLSDRITTVSPTYAEEILRPETGMGFDGLLRARKDRLYGILNGIDTAVWDPAADSSIAAPYDAQHLAARTDNKTLLQELLGLRQEAKAPLVGMISRLSWQKGIDVLLEALPALLGEGMQLALLGSGDAELEAGLQEAAQTYPGRIGVKLGYDETLAHRIQGGADMLLVPSRFEPCGLTQLCALRYGAVPVVARVGGLSDTIIDANEMALASGVATGLQFAPVSAESLAAALRRAARLFRDRDSWQAMQKSGMAADVSWRRPARRYASLYSELCGARQDARASASAA